MDYNVYIKDGEKAVILLEDEGNGVFIASQFFDGVSGKSEGRFSEQEALVSAGFGIYKTTDEKFSDNYEYEVEFDSLKKAIRFCREFNGEEVSSAVEVPTSTITNVYNLKFNQSEPMTNSNSVIAQYEIDAFFTKENLSLASSTLKEIKAKTDSLDRVMEMLVSIRHKMTTLANSINSNANGKDVAGTQKALEKASKVISAFDADAMLSYQANLGKTTLEKEVGDFDAVAFIQD